jgi:hypothetical protein
MCNYSQPEDLKRGVLSSGEPHLTPGAGRQRTIPPPPAKGEVFSLDIHFYRTRVLRKLFQSKLALYFQVKLPAACVY